MLTNHVLAIHMGNLLASLQIMWKGMLAIFVVICAIMAVTAVLNRLTNRKKKENREDTEER